MGRILRLFCLSVKRKQGSEVLLLRATRKSLRQNVMTAEGASTVQGQRCGLSTDRFIMLSPCINPPLCRLSGNLHIACAAFRFWDWEAIDGEPMQVHFNRVVHIALCVAFRLASGGAAFQIGRPRQIPIVGFFNHNQIFFHRLRFHRFNRWYRLSKQDT